jgi:hypothetical protein
MATRLDPPLPVIAEGKVRTYDMGGKASTSTSLKPSPITPVNKSENQHPPFSTTKPDAYRLYGFDNRNLRSCMCYDVSIQAIAALASIV